MPPVDDNAPPPEVVAWDEIDPNRVNVPKTRRDIEEFLRKQIAPDVRRLIEVAKSLGIKPTMLPDLSCNCCDCKDPKRPNFGPMQVRHLCQIKEGLSYRIRGDEENRIALGVISCVNRAPFYSKGEWSPFGRSSWFLLDEHIGLRGTSNGISLEALSVVPNSKDGRWERHRWLEFTDNSKHLAGPHEDHCSCCRHHYREDMPPEC